MPATRWLPRIAAAAALAAIPSPGAAAAADATIAVAPGGEAVSGGQAVPDNPSCLEAGRDAERAFALPDGLMARIGRVESGRGAGGAPWPWTVQSNGSGAFLPGPAAAEAEIARRRAGGERLIDVGCFQVDLRWHGSAFASDAEALDPTANARVAAAFLSALHARTGDWNQAVGLYHSADAVRAAEYRRRVFGQDASDGAVSPFAASPPPTTAAADPYVIAFGPRRSRGLTVIRADIR
ncbi:MAG: lytic transglycosylase domain-containing protein [Gluconacetobacter diazotrophicus]|nr:lytic transglycosylase domain-containing protein [Gluconacetobacter diazotrophicus]